MNWNSKLEKKKICVSVLENYKFSEKFIQRIL